MIRLLRLSVLFILLGNNVSGQNDTITPTLKDGSDFYKYINTHVVYPEFALDMMIQGTVVLSFQINKTGCIDSVKVIESPHILLSNAAIDATEKTNCKWNPAMIKNKPVRYQLQYSIHFSVKGADEYYSLEEALKYSEKVRFLVLNNKGYLGFPNDIYKFKKLFRLELNSNNLSIVPDNIVQLKKLQFLILSSNNIKSVTPEIYKLKKLYKLSLSNNSLTNVPLEVTHLYHLWELDLSRNKLDSIPTEMKKMTSLRRLYLSYNNLNHFPTEIFNNKRLYELDLSHNNIHDVPTEISKLTRLSSLDLSNNKISRLPDSISQLKLTTLNLSGNNLSEFEINRIRVLLPKTKMILE